MTIRSKTKAKPKATPKPQVMKASEMPAGQSPAVIENKAAAPQRPEKPLTAVERAERLRNIRHAEMISAARRAEPDITAILKPRGVEFGFFMAAMEEGLRNTLRNTPDFFEKVSAQSFIEAVMKVAYMGLLPDGKQAAIVSYGAVASALPMVGGFVEIIWRTGIVKAVNYNVIYDGDDIDFREGTGGFVHHKRNLKRKPDAEVIGAWCVIETTTEGNVIEICDQVELAKIARMSKSQKAREQWREEFEKKAPFRRAVKRLPKNEQLDKLIEIDNENYLDQPRPVNEHERRAQAAHEMSDDDMLSNEPATLEQEQEGEPLNPVAEAIAAFEAVDTNEARIQLVQSISAQEWSKDLTKENASALTDAARAAKARLAPKAEPKEDAKSDGPPEFKILMSSQAKEPKVYSDAKLWANDFLAKMASMKADALKVFWKRNFEFVMDAGKVAPEDAKRVFDVGQQKGLNHGE